MYIQSNGDIKLSTIANKLKVPSSTVRSWKKRNSWKNKLLKHFNEEKRKWDKRIIKVIKEVQ